jgi:hypothetical protein
MQAIDSVISWAFGKSSNDSSGTLHRIDRKSSKYDRVVEQRQFENFSAHMQGDSLSAGGMVAARQLGSGVFSELPSFSKFDRWTSIY